MRSSLPILFTGEKEEVWLPLQKPLVKVQRSGVISCLFGEQIQFICRRFLSRIAIFWKLMLTLKNLKPGWWNKSREVLLEKESSTSWQSLHTHVLVFAPGSCILLAFLLGKSCPSGKRCTGNSVLVTTWRLFIAESGWPILRSGLGNKILGQSWAIFPKRSTRFSYAGNMGQWQPLAQVLLVRRDSCVFPKLKVKSSINAKRFCKPYHTNRTFNTDD